MPKDLTKDRASSANFQARWVIQIVSVAVMLFSETDSVFRKIGWSGLAATFQNQMPILIFLSVSIAVVLFVLQPESLRRTLGVSAVVLPVVLTAGIAAGAYVIHAGFASKGVYQQVAFCAIGTILLGEVWIVNESINREQNLTVATSTSASL